VLPLNLALLCWLQIASPAFAQQVRLPHIGWVSPGSPTAYVASLREFRDGMRELGYVEGTTFIVEYRWAEGRLETLPELARQVVAKNVDVIVSGGTPGTRAALAATKSIPIVFAGVGDAVGSGFVASLSRPGGNATGFLVSEPGMGGKRLALLKDAIPEARRVAVLWNPSNSYTRSEFESTQHAATWLNVSVEGFEIQRAEDFAEQFARISEGRFEGLIVLQDPLLLVQRERIVEFARIARIPAIYGFREFVTAGGLMSYGGNVAATYRRAAGYVDRILKGARPADLPVQLPTGFEFVVNMKTVQELGTSLPSGVIAQATHVVD
jgi:putative ABC transport system substrate-binding protein